MKLVSPGSSPSGSRTGGYIDRHAQARFCKSAVEGLAHAPTRPPPRGPAAAKINRLIASSRLVNKLDLMPRSGEQPSQPAVCRRSPSPIWGMFRAARLINDIVKQRAALAGLEPREFSAHGL